MTGEFASDPSKLQMLGIFGFEIKKGILQVNANIFRIHLLLNRPSPDPARSRTV